MMAATVTLKEDGGISVVLGLNEHDIQRLKAGDSLSFPIDIIKVKFERFAGVTLFYKENDQALERQLRPRTDAHSEVVGLPCGHDS